jgi:hypothetical protein
VRVQLTVLLLGVFVVQIFCVQTTYAFLFSKPKPYIPEREAGQGVDAYVLSLIQKFDGEKRPLWKDTNNPDYVALLPNLDKDVTHITSIVSIFNTICTESGGKIYLAGNFIDDLNTQPTLKYSEEYLTKSMGISSENIKKFGIDIQFATSYGYDDVDRHIKPYFSDFKVVFVPRFDNQENARARVYPTGSWSVKSWDKLRELAGVCASVSEDKNTFYFSWLFEANKIGAFVSIRTGESLKSSEDSIIRQYYKDHINEIASIEEMRLKREAETKKNEARYQEEEKRYKIELDEQVKQYAENVVRQKRIHANEQKAKKEQQKHLIGFRKNLKSGDDSHCGLIIDVKANIVLVQTMSGQLWIKKQDVYPPNQEQCRFMNGEYVPPR